MVKRILRPVLAAVLLVGLCGCSTALNREYLSVSEYTDEDSWEFLGDAVEITDYNGLKRAINDMVTAHRTEEKLIFMNYDGVIRSDLDHACWEVRDDTALGSYSVDYMSHDLTRIFTYHKATVYINYKRSASDVESIVDIYTDDDLAECLDNALRSMDNSIVVRLSGRDLTEDKIRLSISGAFSSDPLSCLEEPEAEITIHPNSGLSRIVEIELKYPLTTADITEMRLALSENIYYAVSRLTSEQSNASAAFELYNYLASGCRYDPDGELRRERAELNQAGGGTVYGALVDGLADSRGIALAYSALCREAGIECMVVQGTMDMQEHWWNILKLDDDYYHVDVSADGSLGVTVAFLRSDAQMRVHYWWNIEDYPECTGAIDIGELFSPVI